MQSFGFKFIIIIIIIYCQDIEIEFGIEKCAMFIMRYGKREITEGIEILNQEKNRSLRVKETDKY